MRGIISMLALVAIAAVTAQTAKAEPANAAGDCTPPTISNVFWTWEANQLGYVHDRELDLHFTLKAHGSAGGTLYLKLDSTDPNTNDGNIGEDFNIDSRTSEIGSFNTTLPLGSTHDFSLTYWNGCVGNEVRYGLLVNFTATVGKSGRLQPAASTPDCPAYYVIDSRGSGESNWKLSDPGSQFVESLREIKGEPNVYAVTNPYAAVGIIPTLKMIKQSLGLSWSGLVARMRAIGTALNGFGATIHSRWIGAYNASVARGESNLRRMVQQEVARCRSHGTKILLDGYSQGAQVTASVYQSLDWDLRQHIAGAVLFGDPKYNHRSWAADVYKRDNDGILSARGFFPGGSTGMVMSFCHARDPICQGWGQFFLHGWGAHLSYQSLSEPEQAAAYFASR